MWYNHMYMETISQQPTLKLDELNTIIKNKLDSLTETDKQLNTEVIATLDEEYNNLCEKFGYTVEKGSHISAQHKTLNEIGIDNMEHELQTTIQSTMGIDTLLGTIQIMQTNDMNSNRNIMPEIYDKYTLLLCELKDTLASAIAIRKSAEK